MCRGDARRADSPVGQPEQGRAAAQLARRARTHRRGSPGIACLDNGAYGLTLHWRADNRHTRVDDVRALRALCERARRRVQPRGRRPRGADRARRASCRVTQFTLVPVQARRDHERSRLGPAAPARVGRADRRAAQGHGHPHRDLRRSEPRDDAGGRGDRASIASRSIPSRTRRRGASRSSRTSSTRAQGDGDGRGRARA